MGLPVERRPGELTDAVDEEVQPPLGRDPRVLLAQRAGCRVARVGERGLPCRDEAGVQGGEVLQSHEHLAAHFHDGGDVRPGKLDRDRLDGPDIGRHVLADGAVAAGGGADQPPVPVDQVEGESVDLQLAQEAGRCDILTGQRLGTGQPLVEIGQ